MASTWDATIEGHRGSVRNAILDAASELARAGGVASVTMSGIAQASGISRATLYKYFPDLDAVLVAWHHRVVHGHLAALHSVYDGEHDPTRRLHAVLREYAALRTMHPDDQIAVGLHWSGHMARAGAQLRQLLALAITEAAVDTGVTRLVPPEELAIYCEHALAAATEIRSAEGLDRLIDVILQGMSPRPEELASS